MSRSFTYRLRPRAACMKMKADGMPSNLIAKYTGLTEEEIDLL